MESMAITTFLEHCAEVLEEVHRSRRPVLITRSGEPWAEIVPAPPAAPARPWLGSMKGTGKILGDIVSPAAEISDWDVLRD
jgi:prevent-host-death family protein